MQRCRAVSQQDGRNWGSLKKPEQLRGPRGAPDDGPSKMLDILHPPGMQDPHRGVSSQSLLSSLQIPALASRGTNKFRGKANVRFAAWQRQSSTCKKVSPWGSELWPQPGGRTSLSPSPPQHPWQPSTSCAESAAVLQVMRQQEETPILAWLSSTKAQRSQNASSQEPTRLGFPNPSHLVVFSTARLFAVIGMQIKTN